MEGFLYLIFIGIHWVIVFLGSGDVKILLIAFSCVYDCVVSCLGLAIILY